MAKPVDWVRHFVYTTAEIEHLVQILVKLDQTKNSVQAGDYMQSLPGHILELMSYIGQEKLDRLLDCMLVHTANSLWVKMDGGQAQQQGVIDHQTQVLQSKFMVRNFPYQSNWY